MKTCTRCKIEKQKEEFNKEKKGKDGLCSQCRNCRSKQTKEYTLNNSSKIKEYQEENREKIRQYKKDYYQNNRIRLLEELRQYRQENKEIINQRRNEYQKERRKNDPQFRIAHYLRVRTKKIIVLQGGIKSASTQELLGCTWEEARIHIENQFIEGMTWENHGEWEIDHIRPMASFDLTDPEQQRQCCNYTNLRPLWAEENWSKSSLWNGIKHYHNPN